jgi:hypothetical protein
MDEDRLLSPEQEQWRARFLAETLARHEAARRAPLKAAEFSQGLVEQARQLEAAGKVRPPAVAAKLGARWLRRQRRRDERPKRLYQEQLRTYARHRRAAEWRKPSRHAARTAPAVAARPMRFERPREHRAVSRVRSHSPPGRSSDDDPPLAAALRARGRSS